MNRRAILVTVGAAVGLAVMWFVLLWGPQGGRLQDARERTDAAETQNSALELRLARLRAAQERVPQLQADLEELRRAVPDEPELAQFIIDANDAATASGVSFLSIAPAVPVVASPSTISLSITVRGDYFAVLDYLDRFEALRRIVVIDSLGLAPSEEAVGLEISVSITGRMFATAADVAPAAPSVTSTEVEGDGSQEQVTTSTVAAPEVTVSDGG